MRHKPNHGCLVTRDQHSWGANLQCLAPPGFSRSYGEAGKMLARNDADVSLLPRTNVHGRDAATVSRVRLFNVHGAYRRS